MFNISGVISCLRLSAEIGKFRSKNKQKCCTTLSHCLTTQVEAQDEEHMKREIQNVLAVIKGVDAESDSKNESEYDDSVLTKDFEMPVD
jgi:hypothetical protein